VDQAWRWCPECGGHLGDDQVVIDFPSVDWFPVDWAPPAQAVPAAGG
jgi:hypothetical protein